MQRSPVARYFGSMLVVLLGAFVISFFYYRPRLQWEHLFSAVMVSLAIAMLLKRTTHIPSEYGKEPTLWFGKFLSQKPATHAIVYSYAGIPEGLSHAYKAVSQIPAEGLPWMLYNDIICALITYGDYTMALSLVPGPFKGKVPVVEGAPLDAYLLVHINLAEAEYNLGLFDEAMERLEHVQEVSRIKECRYRLALAGTQQQIAWLLAMQGKVEEATQSMQEVHVEDFVEPFRAEFFYTHAFICLQKGETEAARRYVEIGMGHASRASSGRNGLFLLARVYKQAQQLEDALQIYQAGADHYYRYQGGDALKDFYELLMSVGKEEQAQKVLSWLLERDPQSFAAQHFAKSPTEPQKEDATHQAKETNNKATSFM